MRGWGVTFWYLDPPSESNFLGKRNEEPGFISGYIYLTNYLDNFIIAPKQNPKQTTQAHLNNLIIAEEEHYGNSLVSSATVTLLLHVASNPPGSPCVHNALCLSSMLHPCLLVTTSG